MWLFGLHVDPTAWTPDPFFTTRLMVWFPGPPSWGESAGVQDAPSVEVHAAPSDWVPSEPVPTATYPPLTSRTPHMRSSTWVAATGKMDQRPRRYRHTAGVHPALVSM